MKITKNDKAAFIAAWICGFISYGYIMTHHFLTFDSMWNLYSDQNMISSGRQFLMYACKISSDYDLPWMNGLLAILYLAINSVLLTRLLDVKKTITAVLIAGFTVMFPSVTSTFAYTYTVDGYMLAILLSSVAVFLCINTKWGFIPSIFVLGVSMGIYQAYYSYAIVLCIVILLLDILNGDPIKKLLCVIGKMCTMGIGAYIFYVVSLKVMLFIEGETLSGYQGTEAVAGVSLAMIPVGLKTAFWSFIDFIRWGNVLTTTVPMKIAFAAVLAFTSVIFLFIFIKRQCYKKWYNIVLTMLLISVIPIGATMVAVISPDTYVHLLIRMPVAILFIFAASICELIGDEKFSFYISKANYISLFVMLFEFAVVANVVGFNMNERYEKTYATCVRILDRLEQTDGYKTGDPVAILGGFPNPDNFPSTDITKDDLSGYFGVNGELCVNSTGKYAEFMSHYLNATIEVVDGIEEGKLTETEEFKNMSNFPSANAIRLINGVWVIRLNG